jgi:SLOG family YspA-like protein
MRILVTGSRNWTRSDLVITAIRKAIRDAGDPDHVVIIHGGAQGADHAAAQYAARQGLPVERYVANWRTQGTAAGPIRNQEMVNAGADICLAFPLGESPGTRDCMRRARKAGIPVIEYGADS